MHHAHREHGREELGRPVFVARELRIADEKEKFVPAGVSCSPDGKTLASAGDDQTIKLWNVASGAPADTYGGLPNLPHFAPKAKRVIYLFMCGGPSHIDTFDFHPEVRKLHGQELPASIRMGQRLTGMTSNQERFPLVGSFAKFQQYGQNGTWVSDYFPHIGKIVDEICIVKSMHTEAINHDPAITFFQTSLINARMPLKPWSPRRQGKAPSLKRSSTILKNSLDRRR